MYLPNKYTRWYTDIIQKASIRTELFEYSERHHIIPRSLGGSNKKDNLVRLTAREHFICHWLLVKMVEGTHLLKMQKALWRMLVKGADYQLRYRPNSRTYESLRLKYGKLRKGVITPADVKEKISKANKGKKAWNKGIPRSAEEKKLMSDRRKETAKRNVVWNLGLKHSEETLKKIKERASSRQKYTCLYCNLEVAGSNYFRWHGENCKIKPE
jgi:NUMOD3 motif